MYETALFALGSHDTCRQMASAHDFYLFFHQNVRPKLKEVKSDSAKGAFKPASEYTGETGWIALCGKHLKLVVSSAEWGAAQANMDRKFNAYTASLWFR
jgi:hypothetical protein